MTERGYARDVRAGAAEARDEPETNRIAAGDEDDRNARGRCFSGLSGEIVPPDVKITSTCRVTSSEAIADSRSTGSAPS